MQARDPFMNLLLYAAIMCIFFYSFFDRTYMITILGMLAVTVVLDIAWLIVEAQVSIFLNIFSITGFRAKSQS